jgi:hypothetical protein
MNKEKRYIDENGKYIFPIIKKYYSCFDKTGNTYMGTFEADSDMRAIRMVEDAINDPKSAIGKHPEDYRLDRLFIIDMRSGNIADNETKHIIELKEMKNEQ